MPNDKVRKPSGKEEFTQMWFSRIDAAKAKRDYMKEMYWDKCRDFDAGKQWQNTDPTIRKSKMVLNLIRDGNNKRMASIFSNDPKVLVTPKIGDPEQLQPGQIPAADRAEALEKIIQQIVEDGDGVSTFREEASKAVYEAFLSLGVMKDIYVPKFEPNPRAGQTILDAQGKEVIDPDTGETMVEPAENIVDEKFGAECVDPDMMLVDANTKNGGKDMMWNGEEMLISLEKVKKEELFKREARNRVEATETFIMSPEEERFLSKNQKKLGRANKIQTLGIDKEKGNASLDPRNQLVRIYWVWDFEPDKNGKRWQYAFSPGLKDDFLMKREWSEGVEGGIYTYLQYRDGGKSFYMIPPAWDLLDINIEFNEAMSHNRILRRKNVRKVLSKKDSFASASEQEKLQNDVDLEVVQIKTAGNINDATKIIEPGGPTSADINAIQNSLSLFTRFSGLTPENFGMSEAGTLGQSRLQQGASNVLLQNDHNTILRFLGCVFKKIGQRVQANMTLPRAIEFLGPDKPFFVQVTDAREIAGEKSYSVAAESTTPKNTVSEQVMQDQVLERIQAFGLQKFYDQKKLAENLNRRADFPRDILKSDRQLEQEAIQEQQQLELMQQQAEAAAGPGSGSGQTPRSESGIERSQQQKANPTSNGTVGI